MAGNDGHMQGDEFLGRSLKGYLIEARLGAGATGIVFRARHPAHPRPVALKVLHHNLGSISSLKRRFEREARVLAKLDHPNIVKITDFGVVEEHTFIAMELLEGTSLESVMGEAPIGLDRALDIAKQVLAGLAFAHARQVVHRDLKPANVYLCPDERGREHVKLLDFGLAKMLSIEDLSEDGTLTRKGRIVGTPAYMAPEQITGVSLDVRADVYAVGILLYEMLADRRPFLCERRSELLRAHLLEPVPPLSEARRGLVVHPELEGIIRKALAKDPAHRYANATDMLRAIETLPADPARLTAPPLESARPRSSASDEATRSDGRQAVSESPGSPVEPDRGPAPAARPHEPTNPVARPVEAPHTMTGAEPTERLANLTSAGNARAAPARGPSTPMLWATALALFAIAIVLWLALGRG